MDVRSIKEFFKDTISYLIFIMVTIVLVVYVGGVGRVVGPSMQPVYSDSDIVLVDRLVYKVAKVSRFDVITFVHGEKHYTKRVIGLPGEQIEYKGHKLYINGFRVADDYAKDTEDFKHKYIIGTNRYYVLGDNRKNSEDSRVFGTIELENIDGKIEFKLWPLFK